MFYGIISLMHKKFYASGFIYHEPTGQILLQKPHILPSTSTWTLIGAFYEESEKPEDAFKQAVKELLNIEIDKSYFVYTYFDDKMNTDKYIFYAIINEKIEYPTKNDQAFQWFTFKEILKIQASTQVKHDVVVGQRVIEAQLRKDRGEQSL